MELHYDIKFDISEEEKKNIMVSAIYCELQTVVLLMILAGIIGVTMAVFCGWFIGIGAFMFVTAVTLILRDKIRSIFLNSEIDKLVKQKIARQ